MVNTKSLNRIPHLVGVETYDEGLELFNIDIETAPPMDRQLLIFHSGKDRLIPDAKKHADTFINWAKGEKGVKYYPDGTHVCANYLDETDAYMIEKTSVIDAGGLVSRHFLSRLLYNEVWLPRFW